jgi:predicted phosphoribosyltransferase
MNRGSYRDRCEAGRALLDSLADHRHEPGLLVIGLARGGLPVAAEVAAGLGGELDVAVVRKLGVPGHEELALGAISSQHMLVNDAMVRSLGVSADALDAVIERERRELARRELAYRSGRPPAVVADRTVILVDDGLATGATMHVATLDARAGGARRVIVAVPTAPVDARSEFASLADEFVCPLTPRPFVAVGMWYRRFEQLSDDEVCAILARFR